MTMKPIAAALSAVLLLAACGGEDAAPVADSPGSIEIDSSTPTPDQTATAGADDGGGQRPIDPRKGGFEVGFGEFAVTLEAEAIRPGPVTFVIENRGELVHGFEMEIEGEDEDNSGPGSGDDDGFKVETNTFASGGTIRLDLDLAPGLYKVECFVGDHDDRGMEALLRVSRDAPLITTEVTGGSAVDIAAFAFEPAELEVAAGTEVTWDNEDPAPHTVTAEEGAFDSGTMEPGASFASLFEEPGTYPYLCGIHPEMRGTIVVTG